MSAILLDDNQSSVVSESRGSVHVFDPARRLLGRIVPDSRYGYAEEELWVERFQEWYFDLAEADEEELATK